MVQLKKTRLKVQKRPCNNVPWWKVRAKRVWKHSRSSQKLKWLVNKARNWPHLSFRIRTIKTCSIKTNNSLKSKVKAPSRPANKICLRQQQPKYQLSISKVPTWYSSKLPDHLTRTTVEMTMMLMILKRTILFKWQSLNLIVIHPWDLRNIRQFQIIFKTRKRTTLQSLAKALLAILIRSCVRFRSETSKVTSTNLNRFQCHSWSRSTSRKSARWRRINLVIRSSSRPERIKNHQPRTQ